MRYTDGETIQEYLEITVDALKDPDCVAACKQELKEVAEAEAAQKGKRVMKIRYGVDVSGWKSKKKITMTAILGRPVAAKVSDVR